jgi:O-antigen/teichoic acid export membrane protein
MLYGEEFRPAVPAAMIIAALSTVSVSTVIATHLVQALERSDFIFYTAILGAGLSIVGGFLLVPEFGLIGAAVSRSVVQVIMVAIGLWFVVARLGYSLPTKALLSILAASACSALAAWLVVVVLDAPFSVVAAIPLAGVVYLICLRLFGAVDRENLETLTTLVRLLPKPLAGLSEAVLRFLGQRLKPSASVNVRMVP